MKRYQLLLIIVITFIIGLTITPIIDIVLNISKEKPFFNITTKDIPSPKDRITDDKIQIYKDKIEIKVDNATVASYEDSNSMDPLLDKEANGIEVIPENENDIEIGDVIAYEANWTNGIVVHRVVNISKDDYGIYFVTRGDNNPANDPQRVRFKDIKFILIGVIY